MLCAPGVPSGEQASTGGPPGYSSVGPMYMTPDQSYRMNAGGRPGQGSPFPPGMQPPGMQPHMLTRPVGGPFNHYAQFQGHPGALPGGPPMKAPGKFSIPRSRV